MHLLYSFLSGAGKMNVTYCMRDLKHASKLDIFCYSHSGEPEECGVRSHGLMMNRVSAVECCAQSEADLF